MAYKFNPFTDTLDIVGSGGGSYIDGEVEYHSNLPVTVGTPAVNSAFLVRKGEGLYFISRKPAGIWVRELNNGNLDDWKYAGTFSDLYRDANFRIINDADVSKELAFSLSGLTTGTTRTLTVPDASGTIALTSDITGGGTKTYAVFTATDNQPPATAYATLDTRNSIAVLDFDDATDESAVFVSIIPEGASLGSGLKIRLHWMATTATSGDVVWDVSLERMTTDLDSDSFDTIASGTAAASGTSGILTVTEITLTTIDSVTAGDGYRLKITRDADNGSDSMSGDAELVVCEVRSAA
jgi:hypothetical protein